VNFHHFLHPLKILRGLSLYWHIFGAKGMLHALYCVLTRREKLALVSRRWSKHPLHVRLNTTDIAVFRQVFIEREYGIVEHMGAMPTTVIDGGANIGLTSIFLAQRYPRAKIYAVEPEEANFNLLRLNTRAYPAIEVIQGAIWNLDEPVDILSPNGESWGFRISEPAQGLGDPGIRGFRVSTLLQRFGLERLSLLKLDIKGAEYEVLGDAAHWIGRIDNIVIELHENIRPGVNSLFADATRDFKTRFTSRELTLVCR